MKTIFLSLCAFSLSLTLNAQINLQLDLVSNAFSAVTDITNAGDDRLFVVEQAGRIQIIQASGTVNTTPFLDIDAQVSSGGERGLLGLAFHPNYSENGYFFVNYINNDGNTVVSRFEVSSGDPDLADATSETILLTLIQPEGNHNGGDINFGPDGYLYIASGDGGGAGDTRDYSQNPAQPFGKILRIDVDNGSGSGPDYNLGSNYTIPPTNPLIDGPGGDLDEIWALGLRNPWRFSFDRLTGDMWIGDVGQSSREEINFEPAGSPGGLNYGWRCYEGNQDYNTTGCGPAGTYTFPLFDYGHDVGCSVNGGFVYRGNCPALYGRYLYSDYCTGRIWALEEVNGQWQNEELLQNAGAQYATMGQDYLGGLYLGSLNGSVFRITDTSCSGDCSDLIIDEQAIPNGTYQAGLQLTGTGTVTAGANVTFKAGESIVLKPEFQAQSGSSFLAVIEDCEPAARTVAVPVETKNNIPAETPLQLQLFPNPLQAATTIRYQLPESSEVNLQILDLYGKIVAQPISAQRQEAGMYYIAFDAKALPAGMYLLVIRAGAQQEIKRMEIVR